MTNRVRAVLYGAVAGAFLGICLLILFSGLAALESIDAVLLDAEQARARPVFVVSSGWLYLAIAFASAIGGLVIGVIAYTVGREAEPDAAKFPLAVMLPAAAVTAIVIGYGSARAGLGLLADIRLGSVTVSAFRLIVIILIAGAVGGAVTASVVDALARPAFLGIEGEAVPSSAGAMMNEMLTAVGAPLTAFIVAAAIAIGLSQLLLSLHGAAVVIVFSAVAAVFLFGATLLAYRPWERTG